MVITGSFFNRGNVAILNIYSQAINSKYTLNEDLLSIQIDTIRNCLYNPVFTDKSLAEVKMIYIEKLKDKLNKKNYILKKKINEFFGTKTPYGVNMESNIEDIENVTLEEIKKVYTKLLNSSCFVYVCGDIEESSLLEKFNDFEIITYNRDLLDLSYLKNLENKGVQIYESEFLQSAISLIYQCDIQYDDKLYYPLKIFIEMLNYDIFNVIREKHNFCYYIYAIKNNYLNTIEIVSEIESKNLDKVVQLIDEIIKDYAIKFNDERFKLARNKILNYIKNSQDNPRDLIDIHFGFDFNKIISSIDELEKAYKNVTREEVIEASKKISLKVISILKEAN